MRALRRESSGVAGKEYYAGTEIERLIDVAKTFHQPATEKTSPSRHKDPLLAYFVPERRGVIQNQIQVLPGKRFRWDHTSSLG
jgi:hypothetical protein